MVQERCENCKWFFLRDAGSFWSKSDFVKKKIFSLNKICFKQYNSIISAVWKFVNLTKENYANTCILSPFVPLYCVKLLLHKNALRAFTILSIQMPNVLF